MTKTDWRIYIYIYNRTSPRTKKEWYQTRNFRNGADGSIWTFRILVSIWVFIRAAARFLYARAFFFFFNNRNTESVWCFLFGFFCPPEKPKEIGDGQLPIFWHEGNLAATLTPGWYAPLAPYQSCILHSLYWRCKCMIWYLRSGKLSV